jgi:hypothetical protein
MMAAVTNIHDGDDNDDEEKKKYNDKDELPLFVCVHCGTPSSSLYRQLSASLSSIKAMNCTNPQCNQVVDPYIEREWLLVAIDCILLRPEAYRHVLFNVKEPFETVTLRRALQLTIASSILHAYLKWETFMTSSEQNNKESSRTTLFVVLLGVTSFLDFAVQWLAIYGFVSNIVIHPKTSIKTVKYLPAKLFWALILPMSFQVVSIFVLIWENSKTTRALGSLLIASWQSLAISLIVHNINNNRRSEHAFVSTASLVGFLVLILWRFGVALVLRDTEFPTPCVGYDIDLLFLFYNNHEKQMHKVMPPLCLS